MALAKKCDRCGKLYEYYEGVKNFKATTRANGVILIDRNSNENNYWSRKTYDLCPCCMTNLEAFIYNKEVSTNDTH